MPLAWIALNSVKGLGPVKINALLEKYGTAQSAFEQLPDTLPMMGAEGKTVNKATIKKLAEEQLKRARELKVKVLTLADPDYPAQLKEIYAPPPVLFVKGHCEVFTKHAIAVVGTRRCTQYGKSATSMLVKELVKQQLVIVSGLAHGIDTAWQIKKLYRPGKYKFDKDRIRPDRRIPVGKGFFYRVDYIY